MKFSSRVQFPIDLPDTVAPTAGDAGKLDGGKLEICLPALSWNVIRLTK